MVNQHIGILKSLATDIRHKSLRYFRQALITQSYSAFFDLFLFFGFSLAGKMTGLAIWIFRKPPSSSTCLFSNRLKNRSCCCCDFGFELCMSSKSKLWPSSWGDDIIGSAVWLSTKSSPEYIDLGLASLSAESSWTLYGKLRDWFEQIKISRLTLGYYRMLKHHEVQRRRCVGSSISGAAISNPKKTVHIRFMTLSPTTYCGCIEPIKRFL